MDYKQKYLKYKSKYLELKSGGNICFKLNDNLKVYELFIDKKWKFDIPFFINKQFINFKVII